MSFTIGSLFDGSGGFPLAGFLSGGVPVWASEIEPYPIAVTKSRFPYVKHLGSVTDIKGNEVEPVDVITFGSPCQDLSVAGKRAGLKHEDNGDDETTRSGLFMEAVRIIKEMREATNGEYPRFAVWENVPGAFSSNKGEDFKTVLEELIKIVEPTAVMPDVPKKGWAYADCYRGNGWSIAYRTLDSQYWGVPQRRRRIYACIDLRGECAGEVLFEREGLRGYSSQSRTPWETASGDIASGTGTADCERGCVGLDAYNQSLTGDKSKTLNSAATDSDHIPCVVYESHPMDSRIKELEGVSPTVSVKWHKGAADTPLVCDPIAFEPGAASRLGGYAWNNIAGTLRATPGDNLMAVCYDTRGNGDGATTNTITGDHNNRVTDYTALLVEPTYCIDGDKLGKGERSGGSGLGVKESDTMYTLTAKDVHGVAYSIGNGQLNQISMSETCNTLDCMHDKQAVLIEEENPIALDRAFFNQGQNAAYPPQLFEDGTNPTLVARGPNAVCVRYIVRRLTPTECARLQGFPDCWGHPDKKDDFTDEEYSFWLNVRNTHAEINGKTVKDYPKKSMLTWYNKLHADSSEYKMWGNGIALPTAQYVMEGIADVYS